MQSSQAANTAEAFRRLPDKAQLRCQGVWSPSRCGFCFPFWAFLWLLPRCAFCSPRRHYFQLRIYLFPPSELNSPTLCLLALPSSVTGTQPQVLRAALLPAPYYLPPTPFLQNSLHPSLKPLPAI